MTKIIENYCLQESIGEGQYGKVYRAYENKDKSKEYAVKVVKIQKFKENPKLEELTINEIRILSQVEANPNVVRFIELLKTSNNYYFVYEFCAGGTLESYILSQQHLSEKRANQIMAQLFNAFKTLSKYHILHRDLKPTNILMHNGVIKLADFGFCRPLKDKDEMVQTMLGSPIYMAPEVLRGQEYCIKADIWSLGVVYFEMLFGYCPYEERSIAKLIMLLEESSLKINRKINNISLECEELLRIMLIKKAENRVSWDELFQYKITEDGTIITPTQQKKMENEQKQIQQQAQNQYQQNSYVQEKVYQQQQQQYQKPVSPLSPNFNNNNQVSYQQQNFEQVVNQNQLQDQVQQQKQYQPQPKQNHLIKRAQTIVVNQDAMGPNTSDNLLKQISQNSNNDQNPIQPQYSSQNYQNLVSSSKFSEKKVYNFEKTNENTNDYQATKENHQLPNNCTNLTKNSSNKQQQQIQKQQLEFISQNNNNNNKNLNTNDNNNTNNYININNNINNNNNDIQNQIYLAILQERSKIIFFNKILSETADYDLTSQAFDMINQLYKASKFIIKNLKKLVDFSNQQYYIISSQISEILPNLKNQDSNILQEALNQMKNQPKFNEILNIIDKEIKYTEGQNITLEEELSKNMEKSQFLIEFNKQTFKQVCYKYIQSCQKLEYDFLAAHLIKIFDCIESEQVFGSQNNYQQISNYFENLYLQSNEELKIKLQQKMQTQFSINA
ncbi:Protein kinase-like domain [Pseudocohnilembus persalinus]|uniref:Protein kinase-like domain n=1 Tax=Pseudocohnilembus persalinus TaxID=266149 RepID=A0A0V0QB25_PSEPJ|nr:Protein kinase-like domain [Pseudocohnilembus persalinus]|eukprot:KRW99413.1 Protein kinase-like domain [Pseudocohnilembus persalinus]